MVYKTCNINLYIAPSPNATLLMLMRYIEISQSMNTFINHLLYYITFIILRN